MLGCEDHRAFLYDRGGVREIAELKPLSNVTWERRRDDISDASVEVLAPGPDCCEVLDEIEPARHELVIFRGDDRVWEGPINRVEYIAGVVSVFASDVMWYAYRTIARSGYDNRNLTGRNRTGPVTNRAALVLATELARKEALVPPINVLRYLDMRTNALTAKTSRLTLPYQKTVFEEVDSLAAKSGLDYTVVGRRIILNDVHDVIGRTPVLSDADFQESLVVTSYGTETATRVGVSDGQGHWAAVGGTDPYYGEIEQLFTTYDEGSSAAENPVPTTAEMVGQARRNLAGRFPTPVVVRVPDGSGLSPKANIAITDLVPGVRIPVRAGLTCRLVQQEQKLDHVKVEQDSRGERITVTLSPSPGVTVWDSSGETSGDDVET